jgi:hypothetical protein
MSFQLHLPGEERFVPLGLRSAKNCHERRTLGQTLNRVKKLLEQAPLSEPQAASSVP